MCFGIIGGSNSMRFKKNLVAVIGLIVILNIMRLDFASVSVEAKTNDKILPVNDTKVEEENGEVYLSREEVEELLKKNSEEYEKKLLESKLDTQIEKNNVLEGNISAILGLLAVIIAVVVAILSIVWIVFERRIKNNIGSKLDEVKILKTSVDDVAKEMRDRHNEINQSYSKIKTLEEDVQKSNANYKEFTKEKIEIIESIDGLRKYITYLEVRCLESEWSIKFFAEKENRYRIITELKSLIEISLNERAKAIALVKIQRKLGTNITDDDSNLLNIYNYYVKCIEEEEREYLEKIDIFYEYKEYLRDADGDEEYSSDLKSNYNNWDGYMNDLEILYDIVKASIAMNEARA